mgnify:CR=1 FL=1
MALLFFVLCSWNDVVKVIENFNDLKGTIDYNAEREKKRAAHWTARSLCLRDYLSISLISII